MTLWEFHACLEGWNRAHSDEDPAPEPMTGDRLDELVRQFG